ncbi:hypothetical protein SCP_0801710 [Sparassis crispa]|uniref:Uncharacterized protein n=1 Tax=Sparassis crispa TaxID=139825 RepID=A0A401GTU4_9APHY|nr:hypothetical protein SCP_0801710 [Sparassis crispa]GBE85651.1 hypothetical protein SCP_0801710 [Sparassis crispa]
MLKAPCARNPLLARSKGKEEEKFLTNVIDDDDDVGLAQSGAAKEAGAHFSNKDNRRIARKIDLRILPPDAGGWNARFNRIR